MAAGEFSVLVLGITVMPLLSAKRKDILHMVSLNPISSSLIPYCLENFTHLKAGLIRQIHISQDLLGSCEGIYMQDLSTLVCTLVCNDISGITDLIATD